MGTNLLSSFQQKRVDCVWNVMAHTHKADFVIRRNGRVHLNRQGREFSRLLAAVVCASEVVMLDTPSSEVVKGTGYPLHSPLSPSLPLPCVTVCHHVSTGLCHQLQALQHADQRGKQYFVHLSSEYTDYRKNHQPLTLWRILCLFRICNLFSFFMRKLLSFGICLSAGLECLPPSFTSEFECFTASFIFQLSPSMQYTK